jgi:hypothetical protein
MSRESDYGAFADVLSDVKAYEEASRPPPVVPKTYEWKANFKGIVTLANGNDVSRFIFTNFAPCASICTHFCNFI